MKRSNRLLVHAVVALALVATVLVAPVGAHPDGEAHHNPLPAHATTTMRAFAEDQQSAYTGPGLRNVACQEGSAGGFPCSNVNLAAFMPLSEIGATSGTDKANDIWGWSSGTGDARREFAIIGRVFGTSFVEITVPTAPVYLGYLPTHGAFGSSWRDIKVYADHAFIVSEATSHGMQVFDLTQLLTVANAPVTFGETAHYNRISSAHNIAINEDSGYAYIVGAAGKNSCNGGLHMVDIRNPARPVSAGCFGSDGYTHDTQCVIYSGPDAAYGGREICLSSNEDTITIVDVTNKSNPVQLSRTSYAGVQYTHQGWLTPGQRYFLLDDELDEQRNIHNTRTRVFDVSDLNAPAFVGEFINGQTPAIDHNQYVRGNRVFQANYRAGLRILDITGVASGTLSEVGFFDVYPEGDAAEFNGAWSTYPYYTSGSVVISGIEQGLFVVTPNTAAAGDGSWSEGGGSTGGTPPLAGMHVGDLDAGATSARGGKWNASVTVTVHDGSETALDGATVSGTWSGGATGSDGCTTGSGGTCTITKSNLSKTSPSTTFTVAAVAHSGHTYDGTHHDPDGDSDGTTITVLKP